MREIKIATKRLIIQPADSNVVDYVDEHSGQDVDFDSYMSKLSVDAMMRVMEDKTALMELAGRLTKAHGKDQLIVSAKTQNGEIIGYMSIANTKSQTPWFSIGVVQNEQRKGYGYEMMCGFIEWLQRNAPDKDLLYCVRPDNTASIALVKKVGGQLVEPKSFAEHVILSTYIVPTTRKSEII